MEFLRRLLLQTQAYLKGLSGSQRLAIGACVGLILVSLSWLVNWASTPELSPLLDQPMSAQELASIQQRLDSQGVIYKVSNTSTILVPAEQRPRLLAQLGQQKALPTDISIGFAKMMEDASPWLSMEEQGRRWSIARSYELSRVLREFDGVMDARVLIDEKTRRTIGAAPVTPTASVWVKMAPGISLDKERVFAMASFVSRAVAGMDITNVSVTDASTSRSYSVPRASDARAYDDLEDRQKKEEYFARQIKELLANIPGLLVAVHCELDEQSKQEIKTMHGKPVVVSEKTETMTQERGNNASSPGVVPNTSRAVTPAGGVVDRTEKSISETTSDPRVDITQTTTEAPRHVLKSLSASVNVPRSYLAAVWKVTNKDKEPADADIDSAWASMQKKILPQVETALGIAKGSGAVEVAWFHDDATMQFAQGGYGGGAMEAGVGSNTVMTIARNYGSTIGVGALGVMGLLTMVMMVRRVSEGPVLPGEEPPPPQERLNKRKKEPLMTVSADPIGRAEINEHLMMAKEVDPQTLRTQQVVEQVQDMIKEDLSGAVTILQRWIDADKN